VHTLYRLILFKLYFESGIAKWQSHLHDWHDGSAMTFYYETAPLPTWLAWYAHHLPAWWHHLESWLTLGFELVLPFGLFGPRVVRLGTAAFLTFFQAINAATANYGFFCYLATCLHVFCLDDGDVERAWGWLCQKLLRPPPAAPQEIELDPRRRRVELRTAFVVLGGFVFVSTSDALMEFGPAAWVPALAKLHDHWEPLRLVNTYHLFGHITRARIEPQLETSLDGVSFVEHDFRWKPGRLDRAPGFVAPHQPRVDFQLWFYGLSNQRTPTYALNLLDRACNDPLAIQPLFADELPAHPSAIRLSFFAYHFTTPDERRRTGAWFRREKVDETRPIACVPPTE
jgi:hypothetical protein